MESLKTGTVLMFSWADVMFLWIELSSHPQVWPQQVYFISLVKFKEKFLQMPCWVPDKSDTSYVECLLVLFPLVVINCQSSIMIAVLGSLIANSSCWIFGNDSQILLSKKSSISLVLYYVDGSSRPQIFSSHQLALHKQEKSCAFRQEGKHGHLLQTTITIPMLSIITDVEMYLDRR